MMLSGRRNQRHKIQSLNSGEPATSALLGMAAWKTGNEISFTYENYCNAAVDN